jgi:aspartate kinase
MTCKVLKFGGSILRTREHFEKVTDIVVGELEKGNLPVCVVSAINGVTDSLVEAVNRVKNDDGFYTHEFIEGLYERYRVTLPVGVEGIDLKHGFDQLEHTLEYISSSGELNDSSYAFSVSRGEVFSSQVLAYHLKSRGVDEHPIFKGEDLLVTDNDYRDALVDLEKTKDKIEEDLKPLVDKGAVPIIAGFAGRSVNGRISILGRGCSDDTAVCVAFCLGTGEVVKYVDQKGIMTIDPKFLEEVVNNHVEVNGKLGELPTPEVIPYLSYVEASELMREERIKVVHYKVLNPLIMGDIKFHIKDITDPESEGTVIGPENGNNGTAWYGRPKAISFQRSLTGIRFLPTQSRTPTEVYARVFQALSQVGVDVRYISISGFQISLLMPETDAGKAVDALSSLDVAMDVSVLDGEKGTFSIVGSGMRGVRGFLSRVTGVVARYGVNIEQATQPFSENIIRFSVSDEDIPLAVSALYSEFFNGGTKSE